MVAAAACLALGTGCQTADEDAGSVAPPVTPWSHVPAAQTGPDGPAPLGPPAAVTPRDTTRVPLPTLAPAPSTLPSVTALVAPLPPGVTAHTMSVERHDGFDRVVYDFGGADAPRWRAEYVAEATERDKKTSTPIDGRTILQVHFYDTSPPADSGITEYDGPNPVIPADTRSVTEVYLTPSYEGATQSFIGLDAGYPHFTAATLRDPTRIVVDIHD